MEFVIIFMIASVSARHLLDDFNENSDVISTDISYNQREPHVIDRQTYNVIEIEHYQDTTKVGVSNNGNNNISDDYRLRTNAYTEVVTTERISQGDKIYTNARRIDGDIHGQDTIPNRNNGKKANDRDKIYREQRIYSRLVPIRHTPEIKHITNINKPIQNKFKTETFENHQPETNVNSKPETHLNSKSETHVNQKPEINMNQRPDERENVKPIHNRPDSGINNDQGIPVRTNFNNTNQTVNTDLTNSRHLSNEPHETVLVKPILTNETRDSIPGRNETDTKSEDEPIWVWGTEKPNSTTTEPDSLDDRAAFSGDKCPTGKAKVNGVCIVKD